MGNLDQVPKGFHSLPKPYSYEKANSFEIKMWNLNGTINTPWYGGEYVEEYYKEDRYFHLVLELPDDIKDQVGSGSLIIELDVDINEKEDWEEQLQYKEISKGDFLVLIHQDYVYKLHKKDKTWTEAEMECQREGGHLASVTTDKVKEILNQVAHDGQVIVLLKLKM